MNKGVQFHRPHKEEMDSEWNKNKTTQKTKKGNQPIWTISESL